MHLTRRSFIAASAALPFAARAIATTIEPRWAFLGTDKGQGIYRTSWNSSTGELGTPELAIATEHPTYLALHPKLPVLYAANEANHGDGAVSSFRITTQNATLSAMQQLPAAGGGTCFVSVDETGKSIFAANYGGGNLVAYPLLSDGSLSPHEAQFDCRNNIDCGTLGPNKERQEAPHLHCASLSPDNRFVLACNLGEDAIEVCPIHPNPIASEILGLPTRTATRPGSGPRHVAFHPNGRWLYGINELDCTIDLYDWTVIGTAAALTPRPGSTISTKAAATPPAGCTACEIVISPDGRFAYANTRGENSLVVFRIDPKTGLLTEQQRVQTGGTVTRLIAFDPTLRWLLCMNQGSDSVTVFAHDTKTGKLGDGTPAAKPKTFKANSPMCVEWV